ncbi:MAG: M20/M25/M40 family metallo-hydrolase [Balneolaceae bacterium]
MCHVRSMLFIFFLFIISSCEQNSDYTTSAQPAVNQEQLLGDLEFLSSDDLGGRQTGTEGNRMAQDYIEERFEAIGLVSFGDGYRHLFDHKNQRSEREFSDAVNLIGYVEGTENPDRFIVVTAHYDHLGTEGEEIFNGADDNASGTGGLLAAAARFSENPPENSMMFIAFDAEEQGLGGARWFVENPVVPLEQIVLNVNMDMISNNFDNELYAVGTSHYEFLKPIIEEATADADVNVLFGYDTPDAPQDWTMASDHGSFHTKEIPFVYFGVEDHEHYHQPSDTYENTNPDFYVRAVETILDFLEDADQRLDEVVEASEEVEVE